MWNRDQITSLRIFKRPPAAVFIILLHVLSSQSEAAFLTQYSEWKKLSYGEKIGYVMGIYDSMTALTLGGEKGLNADAIGFNKCVARLKITPKMLVESIDNAYQRKTGDWGLPPDIILRNELMPPCRAEINTERRSLGLTPYASN